MQVYNKWVYIFFYYYDMKYVYDIHFCWIFDQMQLWISKRNCFVSPLSFLWDKSFFNSMSSKVKLELTQNKVVNGMHTLIVVKCFCLSNVCCVCQTTDLDSILEGNPITKATFVEHSRTLSCILLRNHISKLTWYYVGV